MSGSNPYAGAPDVTGTGQMSADRELTVDQMDALRRAVADTVSRTELYLPKRSAVGSELSTEANGPLMTVAVYPPADHPVSVGLSPDADDPDVGLTDEDRNEVAHGLAASTAFRVMSAVGDGPIPAAR